METCDSLKGVFVRRVGLNSKPITLFPPLFLYDGVAVLTTFYFVNQPTLLQFTPFPPFFLLILPFVPISLMSMRDLEEVILLMLPLPRFIGEILEFDFYFIKIPRFIDITGRR